MFQDDKGSTPLDLAIAKSVSDDIIQLLKDKRRRCVENEDISEFEKKFVEEKKKKKTKKKTNKFPRFIKRVAGNIARTVKKKITIQKKLSGPVRKAIEKSVIRRIKSKNSEESPKRWRVKLFPNDETPPILAQSLLNEFKNLMMLFDDGKTLSNVKDDSRLMIAFENVKRLLRIPLVLQHQHEKEKVAEDQTYRDLRREIIVVNGQLSDSHIAMKAEDALRELRGVIGSALSKDVAKHSDVVDWVLRCCTRTVRSILSLSLSLSLRVQLYTIYIYIRNTEEMSTLFFTNW